MWWERALSALGGALLLSTLITLALWLLAIATTDRFVMVQYLYWANPLLVFAAVVMLGLGMGMKHLAGVKRSGRGIAALTAMALLVVGAREFGLLRVASRLVQSESAAPGDRSIRVVHWNASVFDVPAGVDIGERLSEAGTPDICFISIQNNPRLWEQVKTAMATGSQPPSSIYMLNTGDDKVFSRFPVTFAGSARIHFQTPGQKAVRTVPPIVRRGLGWLFRNLHLNHRSADIIEDATIVAFAFDTGARTGRPLHAWFIDMPSNPIAGRADLARTFASRTEELRSSGGLPPPDLIVGDFNIPMGSHSLGIMAPGFVETSSSAGLGRLASWPRTREMLQLDHALAGPGWRFSDYRVIDPGASEHAAQSVRLWAADTLSSSGARP